MNSVEPWKAKVYLMQPLPEAPLEQSTWVEVTVSITNVLLVQALSEEELQSSKVALVLSAAQGVRSAGKPPLLLCVE